MSQRYKILQIIFIVLIIVTAGEFAYYFYYYLTQKNQLQTASSKSSSTNLAEVEEITPILSQPAVNLVNEKSLINTDALSNKDKYIFDPITVSLLSYVNKDFISSISAVISLEYQGKIADIDLKGGIAEESNFKYRVKIRLVSTKNSYQNFFYTEDDLQKAKIKQEIGKEKTIDIRNLHIGDNIIIRESIDLTKQLEKSLVNLDIVKLN